MLSDRIRKYFSESSLIISMRLLYELYDEWVVLSSNLSSVKCSSVKVKMEGRLTMQYHAIEKGMSLGMPRLGFGEKKILDLINDLVDYRGKFGDTSFLKYPLSTIHGYIQFNLTKGCDPVKVRERFEREFLSSVEIMGQEGGVKRIKKTDLQLNVKSFEAFARSRHSIRDYSSQDVTHDEIVSAIRVAQNSPSACNRQAWRVHIFKGQEKNRLLNFQGGCNGFVDSINTAILVAGDLHEYFINEIHQSYVDASLFSMVLMYSFHANGMGSIPLTTSFKRKRLKAFRREFEIPDNHVPTMIIGVGHLKDEFNVAYSARDDVHDVVTYHNEVKSCA